MKCDGLDAIYEKETGREKERGMVGTVSTSAVGEPRGAQRDRSNGVNIPPSPSSVFASHLTTLQHHFTAQLEHRLEASQQCHTYMEL